MLSKNFFLYKIFVIFFLSVLSFSAYALNANILSILSMIEDKKYLEASHLLERELIISQDQKARGYYALLLSQLPLDIPLKRERREYNLMAALWAENISPKKRMQMWIETADSFFKTGELEKADRAYKRALSIAFSQKAQSEMAYIRFKRAWIQINEKNWNKAFRFLRRALRGKHRLKENILSNMGQIWVESQYFKEGVPFEDFEESIQSVPWKQQKIAIEGLVKGIGRIKKKGINKIISLLSENQKISTQALNHILSKGSSTIVPSCQLLPWIETARIRDLNRDKTLSVLNSCTQTLLSEKKESKVQKKRIGKTAKLYEKIERKGIERWPLVHIYEYTGQTNKACGESLHQMVETAENRKGKDQNAQVKKTLTETFRLCKAVKSLPPFSGKAIKSLLSSSKIIQNYQTSKGEWENTLLHLLDIDIFYPVIREHILRFNKKWKGKDLLPILLLSHIQDYQPEEIKSFLNRFSPKPVRSYYLDILIARDFLTVEELQIWLPLAGVDSYRETLPWLKKMISEELVMEQKQDVLARLLRHFPSGGKDKKDASSFLALHYLKADQTEEIFKHWYQISSAFSEQNLALELFEKSLNNREKNCGSLKSLVVAKSIKSFPLLKFIDQCCQLASSEENTVISGFKLPSSLQSSDLAEDFVFLVRIQNKTLWLEKNISQLKDKTSGMIMDLKRSVTKYQKREWHLKALAPKSEALLQRQINIFERELAKLSVSSPYGKKYRELKKIVSQWR